MPAAADVQQVSCGMHAYAWLHMARALNIVQRRVRSTRSRHHARTAGAQLPLLDATAAVAMPRSMVTNTVGDDGLIRCTRCSDGRVMLLARNHSP